MKNSIFVTGATGVMGRELVPTIFERSDADLVLLVHRSGVNAHLSTFLKQYFGLVPSSRIRVLEGDVTQSDLGLSASARHGLEKSVTHVLHAAADTNFSQPLESSRRINLEGTRNVAQFASDCRSLVKFGHISTAYVSGKRRGRIRECELGHRQGFLNSYEQSKYEAERYLQSITDRLPVAIYRPSVVFGDSRTGAVNKMDATHLTMRMMYKGRIPCIPGSPDYPLNLIPNDYAAKAICQLLFTECRSGSTYHIVAGDDKTITLSDFVHETIESFAAVDPTWDHRKREPVISPLAKLGRFLSPKNGCAAFRFPALLQSIRQLDYPKLFDRENVTRVIPDYDAEMPDPRIYLEKVIQYCLRTQWGRVMA